jgi:hypothetical protein
MSPIVSLIHHGAEVADGGGEGHNLNDGCLGVEDAFGGDDDGRMAETGLSAGAGSAVELDDVT